MKDTTLKRSVLLAVATFMVMSTPVFAVEYFLRADVTTKDMPSEPGIPMWGFAVDSAFGANDGTVTVPGPILTVPPGDSNLTIHLDNNLSVPVSVVINGQAAVMTPVKFADSEGRQRIRSLTHETPPGNDAPVDYVWNNFQPGSYIYESGTHPAVQVQMGLYGPAVKDFAAGQAYQDEAYTVGVPLVFSEIDPALHNAVNSGNYGPGTAMTSTIDYKPKYFLINGEPFVPAQATLPAGTSGGGTLLRLFNMGLQTRSVLLQGSYMSLIAEDGQPYNYPKEQYAALLPAGKTLDAMVAFPTDGIYPIYDRRLGLSNGQSLGGGMLARLQVGAGNVWPVITSVTATPASILDTQTSQLMATAGDPDGPSPLSYAWDVPAGAGSLDDPTIANPVFTPAYIAGAQTYTLTVTVADGLHNDIGAVDVTVTGTLSEVIVDNLDPDVSSVGVWLPSGAAGFWATNSVWANDAGDTFTFNAPVVPGVAYAVYEWHTQYSSRYTAVPHQVFSGATLLDTVNVDQQVNGGQWNLLGLYVFADATASVTVGATPGFSSCADAMRFVPMGTLQSLEITGPLTVDEGTSADYEALAHFSDGSVLTVQPQVWDVDIAEASISWTGLLTAGAVDADTPAVISAEYTLNGTVVNDTHNITVLNSGGPAPVEVIVDNTDATTSSVGTWLPSGAAGYYGTNSLWANDTGETFTFTANLVPGTYDVYEWHTVYSNRNSAAPHQIYDDATLLGTVNVDQLVNGGAWNLLGQYTFTGPASITIVASPGSTTNADAVRFVPVP